MRETQNLLIAVGRRSYLRPSRVFANSRLISVFLLNFLELLLGRVLTSVCDAQLRLCVIRVT